MRTIAVILFVHCGVGFSDGLHRFRADPHFASTRDNSRADPGYPGSPNRLRGRLPCAGKDPFQLVFLTGRLDTLAPGKAAARSMSRGKRSRNGRLVAEGCGRLKSDFRSTIEKRSSMEDLSTKRCRSECNRHAGRTVPWRSLFE
jgi:hypothetical protein